MSLQFQELTSEYEDIKYRDNNIVRLVNLSLDMIKPYYRTIDNLYFSPKNFYSRCLNLILENYNIEVNENDLVYINYYGSYPITSDSHVSITVLSNVTKIKQYSNNTKSTKWIFPTTKGQRQNWGFYMSNDSNDDIIETSYKINYKKTKQVKTGDFIDFQLDESGNSPYTFSVLKNNRGKEWSFNRTIVSSDDSTYYSNATSLYKDTSIYLPKRNNTKSTPSLPTQYNISQIGGYNLYNIPTDQLDECVSYLNSGVVVSTSSGFLGWLKLLAKTVQYAFLDWVNRRYDYIISWKMFYHNMSLNLERDTTINVGILSNIGIGNYHINEQFSTLDCGNIEIVSNDFTDYEPYTYYEIYLPFVGTVPLQSDVICGRTLNVKYVIDNVSGEAVCIISTIDGDVTQIIHTYECNVSIDLPYKEFDYLSNIRRNASALSSAIVGGGSVLATNKSSQLLEQGISKGGMSGYGNISESIKLQNKADMLKSMQTNDKEVYEQPTCIRSNVGSSLLSSLLPRKPYVIKRKVPHYKVEDTYKINARPTLDYNTLSSYSGMTVVRDMLTDGINCTDIEKNMIVEILTTGVIL